MRTGGASGTDYTTSVYYIAANGSERTSSATNDNNSGAWGSGDGYVDIIDYDNTANNGSAFEMTIYTPNIATNTNVSTQSVAVYNNFTSIQSRVTANLIDTTTQFTGIKFKIQTSSNHFDSGHFKLYGIK